MIRTLAAAVLAVCLLAVPTTPAAADTPACVTRKEYKSIDNGWLRKKVARRFDTRGQVYYSGYKTIGIRYSGCIQSGPMYRYVIYTRDRGWRVTDHL